MQTTGTDKIFKKQYEIETFQHLCNTVNDDNVEILATDLALWLISYNKLLTSIKKEHPDKYENKNNWDIAKGGFNWIDDGEAKITGFKTKVEDTGETRFYKFPNKD